jgi:hypothetical protein
MRSRGMGSFDEKGICVKINVFFEYIIKINIIEGIKENGSQ